MEEIEERPLTSAEAAALSFVLSGDFPGVEELQAQAPTARVIGVCGCGCPTIHLAVDEANTPPALTAVPGVVASVTSRDPRYTHLMVWVEGDHLSSLELSWIEGPPSEFPPLDHFDPPTPG